MNARRLQLWQEHPTLCPYGRGVLVVDESSCLRDWVEHYSKLVKHELGWADFQPRDAEAIVRHWHLGMLVFTFSVLTEAPPAGWVRGTEQDHAAGKKSEPRIIWQETLRCVRAWLCR